MRDRDARDERRESLAGAWIDRALLALLFLVTVAVVAGFASFGRHPELLTRFPSAAPAYGAALRIFPPLQVWGAFLVLAAYLTRHAGVRWVPAFVLVYALSLTSELLGTGYGIPFGAYHYTPMLGAEWLGRVPVVIPLSWFSMAVASYALARGATTRGATARILLASLLLLCWDLALDPAMSHATIYWVWGAHGPYYGMPWSNLAGWYVTGIVLAAVLALLRADRWIARLSPRWIAAFYGGNLVLALGMNVAAGLWLAVIATCVALAGAVALIRPHVARAAASAARARGTGMVSTTMVDGAPVTMDDRRALALVREGLGSAYERIRLPGSPDLTLDGSLLRPLLALAGALHVGGADDDVWLAALAVQLAHESSLVHDDVIDAAATRRGQPTVAAEHGTARALVEGDHLLTTAYCAAAATRSPAFVSHFARAVERTVAAEKRQGALLGTRVDSTESTRIAEGKSGELTACALAAAALVRDHPDARIHVALGRDIGVVYQMLDDALDYCAVSDHGKPALGDFRQRRWTWPLEHVPDASFHMPERELVARLHTPLPGEHGATPLDRARGRLEERIDGLARRVARTLPSDGIVTALLTQWRQRVAASFEAERVTRAATIRAALERRVGVATRGRDAAPDHLARHARSFHFASRLLPPDARAGIARVYAFCRVMDDLVDEPVLDGVTAAELLELWVQLASDAYDGAPSGLDVIDEPMREMAAAGVPFDYVTALAAGMRMDLRRARYATMTELRAYAHCVAGVVGLWIARLAGVRDPRALEHAARMGEAMQLSNIARDVGEDHARGRLYLPSDVLARHGLDAADVGSVVQGIRPVDGAYRAVLEEIMRIAEADYDAAFGWLPALPGELRPCMAVAARVYAGIHDAVRRVDYAPTVRARTSTPRKLTLAARALLELRALGRRDHALGIAPSPEASHG